MSTGKLHKKDGEYAHHFKNSQHEYVTSKEGVWVFLTSEILMFGALFVGFFIYSHMYPEVFKYGAKSLDWRLGALNTIVLLTSSLTMALGIYYCQKDNKQKAVMNLAITILCGATFMVVKYFEYSHKIHDGKLPGMWFTADNHGMHNLPLYFSFYFMMTGLHGIHVLAGMGLITWILIRTQKGEFGPKYYTPVEGVGLFWHLVDLIWIFLFPLLYLI